MPKVDRATPAKTGETAPRRNSAPRATNRERPNTRGEATRLQLILTAERLFAERGIAAVPLLDIGVAAGQKNNIAVQYHFGDREGLIQAILAHRAVISNTARAEMIADLAHADRRPLTADVVRAFVLPLAQHLGVNNYYIAFFSRFIIERGGYTGFETTIAPGTVSTLRRMLTRLLPDIPHDVLSERWIIMTSSAVLTLARYQARMQNEKHWAPSAELLEDLVQFLTAGLESSLAGRSTAIVTDA